MTEKKNLVIYHKQCVDGFASAFVCYLAFGHSETEYLPLAYGERTPPVNGRNLYVVDFSFPREEMKGLIATARKTHVYDHHKTAQANLDGINDELAHMGIGPAEKIVFDMDRSGAGITWDELMLGAPRHWLIDYVEDRDIWKWKLDSSREVNAYISALPFTFDAWQRVMDNISLNHARDMGTAIRMKQRQYCVEVARNARDIRFEGNETMIVNAPQHDISELLEYLMDYHGMTFMMGYFQRSDGLFQYSLRSRGDFDVSALAKAYGGGGHKNAAGFQHERLIV